MEPINILIWLGIILVGTLLIPLMIQLILAIGCFLIAIYYFILAGFQWVFGIMFSPFKNNRHKRSFRKLKKNGFSVGQVWRKNDRFSYEVTRIVGDKIWYQEWIFDMRHVNRGSIDKEVLADMIKRDKLYLEKS